MSLRNDTVAGRWVEWNRRDKSKKSRKKDYATSNSMSFSENWLSSYRTRIGNIVRDRDGELVALLTTRKYGVTTAQHINKGWRAAVNLLPVCYVDDVANERVDDNVRAMLAPLMQSLDHAAASANRGDYLYADRYLGDRLLESIIPVLDYTKRFGGERLLPDWNSLVDAALRERKARQDVYNDPKNVAARERAQARRAAIVALGVKKEERQ